MNKSYLPYRKNLLTLLLTLGGLCVAACAFPWHGFTLVEWWRESHSSEVRVGARTREKVVALTFDDGPDPRYTPRILAILRRYNIKATFFLIGKQVQANPELARQIVAQGHIVGNHTYDHPYLNRETPSQVFREIQGGAACLASALGIRTHLFRPPRGDWNPTIYRAAQKSGERIVLWTVSLDHHEVPTPRAMTDRALRLLHPGGILLMHDGARISREKTVRALPLVIEGLRRRGYRFVTVPELLHVPGDDPLKLVHSNSFARH